MTQLETEMRLVLIDNSYIETVQEMTDVEKDHVAKAAALVAKRYIEKAFISGYYAIAECDEEGWPIVSDEPMAEKLAEKWLKSNGITSDAKEDPLESAIPSSSFEGRLLSLKQTYESEIAFRDSIIKDLKTRLREL